jgi:hypothetical protein
MNKTVKGPRTVKGGAHITMEPPTSLDALLYLKRVNN